MESITEVVVKGEPIGEEESSNEIKSEQDTLQLQDEIKKEIDDDDDPLMDASSNFQLKIKSEMEEDNMDIPIKTEEIICSTNEDGDNWEPATSPSIF